MIATTAPIASGGNRRSLATSSGGGEIVILWTTLCRAMALMSWCGVSFCYRNKEVRKSCQIMAGRLNTEKYRHFKALKLWSLYDPYIIQWYVTSWATEHMMLTTWKHHTQSTNWSFKAPIKEGIGHIWSSAHNITCLFKPIIYLQIIIHIFIINVLWQLILNVSYGMHESYLDFIDNPSWNQTK